MWPPRIQVAGVSSLEEALFCHRVGVDALGFTLELPSGLHDGLTKEKAGLIIRDLPQDVLPVVITYLTSASDARRLVREVGAKAIQFHGGMTSEQIEQFRGMCPTIKTIACITVRDRSALDQVATYSPQLWDAIILDSYDPVSGKRGATGVTHDWTISAAIVRSTSTPVILAGGLNPNNVAEAIRTVRPAGVDAHTGLETPAGGRDYAKIAGFAQQALHAFRHRDRDKSLHDRDRP